MHQEMVFDFCDHFRRVDHHTDVKKISDSNFEVLLWPQSEHISNGSI
jgi:hypothetical protein